MSAAEALQAEDFAFSRLIAYAAYQWPGYADAAHHRLIARHLEAVERGEITRLTYGGNNTAPGFSPDGQWIVFASSRDGDFDLYVMRPDGSDVRQLTFNVGVDDWQPRWGK